ncbi:helicase C-terminal domain-containing protein [Macrococcus equi]|uniref:helicase C-terminal domain-containing protein n=1 Tax=Macrococcus equi TaxID=3395462 RepID=UPI0039BE775B
MALKYAIVDLETTGNNIDHDAIIQIGVCIMQDNIILETFDSFIYTDQSIPPFIQSLTKINNDMVENAPTFDTIAANLYRLLDGCVFVAHNVDFDLNFLKKYFMQCRYDYQPKYIIDTVDVFKIIFPDMERYQLSYLSEQLQINLDNAHRAIDDALATSEILSIALTRLSEMPFSTLKRLYGLAKEMRYHFDEILFDIIKNYQSTSLVYQTKLGIDYLKQSKEFNSFQIDMNFDEFFKNIIKQLDFVFREEQLHLSYEIFLGLKHKQELTIEAELGSGKTLSYLIAAAYFVATTNESILISTSTIALQNQMIEYDIKLLDNIGIYLPYQIIKSKNHYLTVEFVDYILNDSKVNHDILLLKMQLLIYLMSNNDGDIEKLNLNGGRKIYFDLMKSLYQHKKNETYLFNMIDNIAHIGITNHAHLLSGRKQSIFHNYQHIIIDEAHQILNYALKYTTKTIKYQDIKYLISQTIQEFDTKEITHKQKLSDLTFYQYGSISDELHQLNLKYELLFDYFRNFYSPERIVRVLLKENDEPVTLLHEIIHALNLLLKASSLSQVQRSMIENLKEQLKQCYQHIITQGDIFLTFNNQNKSGVQLVLKDSKVKAIIKQFIMDVFDAKIFISGTINSLNEQNILSELFTDELKYIKYESNFQKYTAPMYIPNDIPAFNYQNQERYLQKCLEYILLYLNSYEGKALILLNSYQQVEILRDYLYDTTLDQIILTQTSDANTTKLNQQFNQLDQGVLLATQTFYEGIDFKYDGIKCVMIVSLPFMHPNDLNIALMKEEVNDVFLEYQVPIAVNKLHQATGRLIRNEQDRGWMICFDRRIKESSYAHKFNHILRNYQQFEGDIEYFEQFLHKIYKSFI